MKILMVASTFPRWAKDTQAPFVFQLAEHVAKRGHDVTVLAPHAHGAKFKEQQSGITIRRFAYFLPLRAQKLCYGAGMLPNIRSSWLAKIQVPFFMTAEWFAIIRHARRIKPDVIHAHWLIPQGIVAVLAQKLAGAPIALTAHGSDLSSFRKGLGKKLITKAANSASMLTVNSSVTHSIATSLGATHAKIVPMGVDIDLFADAPKTGFPSKKVLSSPIILLVGRLIPLKGFEYVIKAMPSIITSHPQASLAIIGEGPEKTTLTELAKKEGVAKHVHFIGKLPPETMPEAFTNADIFVCPSIDVEDGGTEALGMVILEALAAKTPVVATKAGGIMDIIVDGKNGLLVNQKSSKELAEAVCKLLANQKMAASMSENGFATVKATFTWPHIAEQFEAEYHSMRKTA